MCTDGNIMDRCIGSNRMLNYSNFKSPNYNWSAKLFEHVESQ